MTQPVNLIDSYLPATRTKPMRVLCLGMCRTGTESLYEALRQLDFSPYKGKELMQTYRKSIKLWTQALDAKYQGEGGCRIWGRQEFDVLLGNYDAVLDVPVILLTEDILRAYPDAKVVLTLRDEDSWLRSMRETAGHTASWWTYPYIWQFHERTRLRVGFLWKCMAYLCNRDFSDDGPAREAFRKQNALVRKLVPPEQLLEFRSEQGWAPLCKFLGKDMPNSPYPRINDRATLMRRKICAYYIALAIAMMKIGAWILTPILIVRYLWWR